MIKIRIVIPCRNHSESLKGVLERTPSEMEVLVIDDGSEVPVCEYIKKTNFDVGKNVKIIRKEKNGGKAAALTFGFKESEKEGFSHAITMDADGQHPPELLEKFVGAINQAPDSIYTGVRDFENSGVPPARRFMNKFSNFWFKAETGIPLRDTQCGFRAYPLEKVSELNLSEGGFTFEAELLVKAAWSGMNIGEIEIPAVYTRETSEKSHYKPFSDTAKFFLMNTKFFFASIFLGKGTLKKISLKKRDVD